MPLLAVLAAAEASLLLGGGSRGGEPPSASRREAARLAGAGLAVTAAAALLARRPTVTRLTWGGGSELSLYSDDPAIAINRRPQGGARLHAASWNLQAGASLPSESDLTSSEKTSTNSWIVMRPRSRRWKEPSRPDDAIAAEMMPRGS